MNNLDLFVSKLCGTFDNSNQIKGEVEKGKQLHPSAKHINGICNDKIKNLPDGFNGYFVIEESYYENGNFKNSLPHLFLFTLDESNNVVLTSYEIPNNIEKEDFRNDNEKLIINFEDLKVSKKFKSIADLGDSLDTLVSINSNVDELIAMKVPYGETKANYEKLTNYLYRANRIHSDISKKMQKL